MAENSNSKSDQYEARLTQAIEDLRGNVKWTLIAFGAIGTTLLAGSQLSNLGKFQYYDHRLQIAIGCALAALFAAAYAVRSALKVAYAGYTELYSLTPADVEYIQHNVSLLEGFGTFQALKLAYENSIATRHADLVAPMKNIPAIRSNEIWFGYLDGLIKKALSYVRYNNIRQQAVRSRRELIGASIVAAVALVGFAWAANPKEEQATVVLTSPTSQMTLALTGNGKKVLAPLLGANCVASDRMQVIVLNVSTTGSDVVSLKTKDCPLARFTITDPLGKLSSP